MAIPELPVSRPIQVAENPKYVVTIGVIVTAETELGAAECVPAIVRSSIGVSSPLKEEAEHRFRRELVPGRMESKRTIDLSTVKCRDVRHQMNLFR